MSAVETAKLKPGDKVLVYSPRRLGGGSTGWYIVMRVGASAAAVIRAETLDVSQCVKVFDGDIVEVLRPQFVDIAMLPAPWPMDLDSPLPEVGTTTPSAEQVPPPTFVLVRITQPQTSYRLDFRGKESVEYTPKAHGRDRLGQPTADFIVEKAHAALLARNDIALELIEDPVGTPAVKAGR
jgi:hypothetical protein